MIGALNFTTLEPALVTDNRFDIIDNAWPTAAAGFVSCPTGVALVDRQQHFETYEPFGTGVSLPAAENRVGIPFASLTAEQAPWNVVSLNYIGAASFVSRAWYLLCAGPFDASWDGLHAILDGVERAWDLYGYAPGEPLPSDLSIGQIVLLRDSSDPAQYDGEPGNSDTLTLWTYEEVQTFALIFTGFWPEILGGQSTLSVTPYRYIDSTPPAGEFMCVL